MTCGETPACYIGCAQSLGLNVPASSLRLQTCSLGICVSTKTTVIGGVGAAVTTLRLCSHGLRLRPVKANLGLLFSGNRLHWWE